MTYAERAIQPDAIEAMRGWLKELDFMDMDPEDFDEFTSTEVLRGVMTYYDGGVQAFLIAEGLAPADPWRK